MLRRLARLVVPQDPLPAWGRDDVEHLRLRFGRWGAFQLVLFLVLTAAATWATGLAFQQAALIWHPPRQAFFAWDQDLVMFVMVAVPIGAAIAVGALAWVERALLRAQVDDYHRYQWLRYSTSRPALAHIAYVFAAVAVCAQVLLADRYVQVRADAIVENPFWGLRERRHPYTRVDAVLMYPSMLNGSSNNLLEQIGYEVIFDDGARFGLGGFADASGFGRAGQRRIAQFVSRSAGKPIAVEQFQGQRAWKR